jgi:hypothetical protein
LPVIVLDYKEVQAESLKKTDIVQKILIINTIGHIFLWIILLIYLNQINIIRGNPGYKKERLELQEFIRLGTAGFILSRIK